jgi:hypothetical protein
MHLHGKAVLLHLRLVSEFRIRGRSAPANQQVKRPLRVSRWKLLSTLHSYGNAEPFQELLMKLRMLCPPPLPILYKRAYLAGAIANVLIRVGSAVRTWLALV